MPGSALIDVSQMVAGTPWRASRVSAPSLPDVTDWEEAVPACEDVVPSGAAGVCVHLCPAVADSAVPSLPSVCPDRQPASSPLAPTAATNSRRFTASDTVRGTVKLWRDDGPASRPPPDNRSGEDRCRRRTHPLVSAAPPFLSGGRRRPATTFTGVCELS